jgi:serine/threonine protein kinase
MIPVVGSNGHYIQFGAVIMLKPSFSSFFVISNGLDMTNDDFLIEAARLFCCLAIYINTPLEINKSLTIPKTDVEMVLDLNQYHLKFLKDFYACTGNIQSSLFHYFKIMSQLHRCPECRKVIIFPICVREYDDDINTSSIVFPKLGSEYKIGLPDTETQRECFFEKLNNAIKIIHKAGVVHLDLYLSNIMWKELDSDDIEIKIIDWDAGHFTAEPFYKETQTRLSVSHRADLHKKVMMQDNINSSYDKKVKEYYDISLITALKRYADHDGLRSRNKTALDKTCLEIQKLYIAAEK